MSKSDSQASGGLMSSAGLNTYYESENPERGIDPKTITIVILTVIVLFTYLNIVY